MHTGVEGSATVSMLAGAYYLITSYFFWDTCSKPQYLETLRELRVEASRVTSTPNLPYLENSD
jgi:hypothetical protein